MMAVAKLKFTPFVQDRMCAAGHPEIDINHNTTVTWIDSMTTHKMFILPVVSRIYEVR